jgi:hypothetical protein
VTSSDKDTSSKSDRKSEEVIDLRKSRDFNNIEASPTKIRFKLAKYLVLGYLALNFLAVFYLFTVLAVTRDWSAITAAAAQTVDIIKTLAAVFGGLLGTVVTYYFLSERKSENS